MRAGIDCRKMFDYGIGTYVRGLAGALAEMGRDDEYVLFAPSRGIDLLPAVLERVVIDTPNYSVAEQFVMPRAIARARLDVFHSPHFVLPLVRPCPMVVTLHDLIALRFPPANPAGALYMIGLTLHAARAADRVLTVSDAAKAEMVRVLACEPSDIVVTPNGVDRRFFEPGPAATQWGRYFLYVGNDKPHKNVPRLVDAFRIVRRAVPSMSLVLIGAPFERYRGEDGVICAGRVDDSTVAAAYRGATALLMVSLEEGFGLPVLEAMASGAPAIVSYAPALVEIAADAALRVDARSPAEIAAAMLRIAADDVLAAELAVRGRARARHFTWRRCAELTRAVYRDVARR